MLFALPCAPLRSRLLPCLGLLLALSAALSEAARAVTRIVTNTNDSGSGSLRAAVAAAGAGDSIQFSVTGTITLTSGQIRITQPITITGAASLVFAPL